MVSSETGTVFTIAADPSIQSSLLEAVLEYLMNLFFDTYDKSLLASCYGEVCNIFDGFYKPVENTLKNYHELDIVKSTLAICRACNKTLQILIRKSLVKESTKPTTPIVYVHAGHSLLCYVDKNFKVRGAELVSVTY